MEAKKEVYDSEDDLIQEYCDEMDCNACNGSDDTGEPNGYGCPGVEDFVDKNFHLIKNA